MNTIKRTAHLYPKMIIRRVHQASIYENYYNLLNKKEGNNLSTSIYQTTKQLYEEKEVNKQISLNLGHYLQFLSSDNDINKVLEIGTFTGYSTSFLAKGLFDFKIDKIKVYENETCDNKIISSKWDFNVDTNKLLVGIDKDSKALNIANHYLGQIKQNETQIRLIGNGAMNSILNIPKGLKFDLIFLDANKSQYWDYYDAIINQHLLSDNGKLIIDNVLFHGEVINIENKSNLSKGIAYKLNNFNYKVINDKRTSSFLLPSWDGLMIVKYNKNNK